MYTRGLSIPGYCIGIGTTGGISKEVTTVATPLKVSLKFKKNI